MDPMLLATLLSMAPGLLSKLFSNDPQKRLREQLQGLLSPANIGALTGQFYRQAVSGPAYSGAQGSIAAGANVMENRLGASLGARGIGTTGTGAILSSLTPSIVGQQQGALKSAAWTDAQSQALANIKQQIEALTGTQGPSQTQQYLAGGLQSLGPLVESWLRAKYPGSFAPVGRV